MAEHSCATKQPRRKPRRMPSKIDAGRSPTTASPQREEMGRLECNQFDKRTSRRASLPGASSGGQMRDPVEKDSHLADAQTSVSDCRNQGGSSFIDAVNNHAQEIGGSCRRARGRGPLWGSGAPSHCGSPATAGGKKKIESVGRLGAEALIRR